MRWTLKSLTGRETEAQKKMRHDYSSLTPQVFSASQRPRCDPISRNGKLSPGKRRVGLSPCCRWLERWWAGWGARADAATRRPLANARLQALHDRMGGGVSGRWATRGLGTARRTAWPHLGTDSGGHFAPSAASLNLRLR